MKHGILNEHGNVGFIGIILASVVGVTGLFIQNQTQKASNKMALTQIERAVDSIEMRNASQLARTLGLFSIGGGRTVPAIYPINYFGSSWQLAKQNGLNISGVRLTSPTQIELTEALNDFSNQTTSWGQTSSVELIQPVVDPNHPYHVTSLAVKVTAQDSGKTNRVKTEYARIPIDLPKGRNPVLQILDAGTFRPLANNELINPGTQTFRVIADGVVLDARITLNGATFLERIAGFDGQGTPKSQAFNPAGTAQVVGSFTADFVGMLNPMGVADWGKLDQYSDGGNSCTILNFPPPGGSPSPSTANVSVDLRGVDDGFDAASTKTFPLKISAGDNGFANSSNYNDDANPNNFVAACPNTCDHYGVTDFSEKLNGKDWWVWEEEARVKQLRSGQFRDIYNPNGKKFNGLHYIAGPYYICTDYTKMGPHILSYYGAQNLSELSDQQIGSAMGNSAPIAESSEWVAYDIRDCKPRFVVARSDCGCFRESTKIQLADGSQKPIEQLSEHDLIYNPMNQKSYAIRQMIQGPENKPLYLIKIGQRQIEVTEEHPFPSKRGLLPAASLKAGDQVADGQDGYETIESIELRQYEKSPIVWNLELEAGADAIEHYVLADGVVTGDLFLQKSLKNKNVKP